MGTQIIINARARTVRASLSTVGGETTIFAVDLIGDSWDDFSQFTDEANAAEQNGDFTRRNRYVRAATAALFSHLDGVISDVFELLRANTEFSSYQPKNPDFCSLKSKALSITNFLVERRGFAGDPPPFEFKLLRDILNHPTVTKASSDPGSRETVRLDSADIYAIAIEDLQTAASQIGEWLNAVCGAVSYERFIDTKRLVEDFATTLGTTEPSATRPF